MSDQHQAALLEFDEDQDEKFSRPGPWHTILCAIYGTYMDAGTAICIHLFTRVLSYIYSICLPFLQL